MLPKETGSKEDESFILSFILPATNCQISAKSNGSNCLMTPSVECAGPALIQPACPACGVSENQNLLQEASGRSRYGEAFRDAVHVRLVNSVKWT